jgi:hypothetical protein
MAKMMIMGGMTMLIGNTKAANPLDSGECVPVCPQDQTSPPVLGVFAQAVTGGEFSLYEDTTKSGGTTLNRKFRVENGTHSLALNKWLILLDVIADVSLQARVTAVALNVVAGVDEITIDRPIDHVFPAGGPGPTLGRETLVNMKIDGSADPEFFSIRAGTVPRDFYTWVLVCEHTDNSDASKFCGLTQLTNGLLVRLFNGVQQTLFNIRSGFDVKLAGGTAEIEQKTGAGNYISTYTIPIREKFGVAQRISGLDVIQTIPQDNLSDAKIISMTATLLGHVTEGEIEVSNPDPQTITQDTWTKVTPDGGVNSGQITFHDSNTKYYATYRTAGQTGPSLDPTNGDNAHGESVQLIKELGVPQAISVIPAADIYVYCAGAPGRITVQV